MFLKKISFVLIISFCAVCFVAHAAEPDWNQFRGPNSDNMAFSTGLLKTWPEGGPKVIQKIEGLGTGYSNFSFDAKRMYTLGDLGDSCCVMALDRKTRKILWSTPIGKSGQVGRYYGPRATPATDGKTVFAFSQFGDFASVDAETGKLNWTKNVSAEFGGKYMGSWGYATSPVLEGDLIVLQIGGEKGTLAAFSRDGKIVWRSAELKDDASYATAVPAEIDGVRQFLVFTPGGISGIDAKNGKRLWFGDRPSSRAICSDPIYKDGVVYVSSGYKYGCNGFRVTHEAGVFHAEEIYADAKMESHHGGVVLVGDHVYLLTNNQSLACQEIATGEVVWETREVRKGSLTYADGHLIIREERAGGAIILVEANPKEFVEKGRFSWSDFSEKQNWTYPLIVDGMMFIRDQDVTLVYDLRAGR